MAVKIVVTGPVCAGKTSFVRAVSGPDAVSTEAPTTSSLGKDDTTVGMDVGTTEVAGRTAKLFGTPGQGRFAYMWEILATGADAVVLLVPADRPSALAEADSIASVLQAEASLPMGVGITRADRAEAPALPAVRRRFGKGAVFVERIDGRVPADCRAVLAALMQALDAGTGRAQGRAPGPQ